MQLGSRGRAAFRLLGSSQIHALNYRGTLAIVGRRSLFAAYDEKVVPAVHTTTWGWAGLANVSVCVTLGTPHLSELLQRETARTAACRKNVGRFIAVLRVAPPPPAASFCILHVIVFYV